MLLGVFGACAASMYITQWFLATPQWGEPEMDMGEPDF